MKKNTLLILGAVVVIGGLLLWSQLAQQSDDSVLAQNGLHWHPTLTIYMDGEPQEIPANIGLGAVHAPMHTHDEDVGDGVVHLEFSGVVHKDDTRLGVFFTSWGKDIRGAFGTLESMKVNGVENTELENYALKEKDKVELYYASENPSVKVELE